MGAAFLEEAPVGKPEINHLDGDRTNNCIANLEWSSRSENMLHCFRELGVYPIEARPRGENHWSARLTEDLVRESRKLRSEGLKVRTIAERFGIPLSTMKDCLRGKTWAHVD